MQNYSFCFVILHYKTYDDTKNCIESIIKCNGWDYIVVVDNNSANGSYEKLVSEYHSDRVHFIHNEQNIGFANGNNVGYKYARDILKSHFIAVINNDTIIMSENIVQMSIEAFEKYCFYILGPDIVSVSNKCHQNPMIKCPNDIRSLRKRIIRYKALYLVNKTFMYDVLSGKKKKKRINDCYVREASYDVQLHGSFLIYSPLFVKDEKRAFCDKTFLYCEEAILFNYCERKGYKTLYYPNIKVAHQEDASTDDEYNNKKEKRAFIFKNLILSYTVLVQYLRRELEW